MNKSALTIIQNMSDAEAVRFLQYFGNSLFKETPREVILSGISPEVENLSEVKQLKELDAKTRSQMIGPEDSAEIARAILTVMAKDEALAPALVHAWETYEPDELFVETILAVGFVASMLLFTATTKIKIKLGNIGTVDKGVPEKGLIDSLFKPITKLIDKLPKFSTSAG